MPSSLVGLLDRYCTHNKCMAMILYLAGTDYIMQEDSNVTAEPLMFVFPVDTDRYL